MYTRTGDLDPSKEISTNNSTLADTESQYGQTANTYGVSD